MPTREEVETLRQEIRTQLATQVSIQDPPFADVDPRVPVVPSTDLFQVFYLNGAALLIARTDESMMLFIFNVDTFPSFVFKVEQAVERTPIPIVSMTQYLVKGENGNLAEMKGGVYINDAGSSNGRLIISYVFKVASCDDVFGMVEYLADAMAEDV